MNIKRKSELEDITNTNTNYNKKLKAVAPNTNYYKKRRLQQRSPSPLEPQSLDLNDSNDSTSPRKEYHKSVTFDCPLLTPKDEDYYGLDAEKSTGVASNAFDGYHNACDDNIDNDPKDSNSTGTDLESNADYIVLTSSLRLLSSNHQQILKDIDHLSGLLTRFQSSDNQDDFLQFFDKLINNDLNLPKQHKILKAPIINLNKYSLVQDRDVNEDLAASEKKPLFKTLNLFRN